MMLRGRSAGRDGVGSAVIKSVLLSELGAVLGISRVSFCFLFSHSWNGAFPFLGLRVPKSAIYRQGDIRPRKQPSREPPSCQGKGLVGFTSY